MSSETPHIPFDTPADADARPAPPAGPPDGPSVETARANGVLRLGDVGSNDGPTVEIAYKWSKLFESDHEFRGFFKFMKERTNPEGTNLHRLLGDLPTHFAPESLPLPLRKWFLRQMQGRTSEKSEPAE